MKPIADFPTTSKELVPPTSYAFTYTIGVALWLTRTDLDLLIHCARHHYDWVCQSFGSKVGEQTGRSGIEARENGCLTILRDIHLGTDGERTLARLTQREIDTMLKILEMARYTLRCSGGDAFTLEHAMELGDRLRHAFFAINNESARLHQGASISFPHLTR